MIEVKHLDKSFGDLHILKDISTNIEKGEKVVIIGPSGSGKSTFLRCLNRLEQPSDGQIFFEGEDLTHMPDRQLYSVRQKMGICSLGTVLLLAVFVGAFFIVGDKNETENSGTSGNCG